jgi:hypothetical protein
MVAVPSEVEGLFCFETYLKGSDIGLTKGDEDIDALACLDPNCEVLLISTTGSAKAHGTGGDGDDDDDDDNEVRAKDEDLLACRARESATPLSPALHTCVLYFDGSDVDLKSSSEDVDAAWLRPDGSLWLSTKGSFSAEDEDNDTSVDGKSDEVFGCAPDPTLGEDTHCFFFEVFDGDDAGLDENIDGLWSTFDDAFSLPSLAVQAADVIAADSQAADVVEAEDALDAVEWAEALSEADEEVDAHDFMDVVQQIYLPVVNR